MKPKQAAATAGLTVSARCPISTPISTVRTDTNLLLATLVSIEDIGNKEGSHTSFKIE